MTNINKLVNTENQFITIVLNGVDFNINAKEEIELNTNERFGSDNFYVDGDCDNLWKVTNENGKSYLRFKTSSDYGWSSFKSEYGESEVTV